MINKGGITYKNTPWHRDCFTCNNCKKVLAGEKFTSRDDKPYCADCFGDLFAKKCIKCTKPITGTANKVTCTNSDVTDTASQSYVRLVTSQVTTSNDTVMTPNIDVMAMA